MNWKCKLFGHDHTEENETCDRCGMHEYYDSSISVWKESNESEHYENSAVLMMPIWNFRNKIINRFKSAKKILTKEKCYHCKKTSHEVKWKINKDRCPHCNELRLPF